MPTLNQNSVNQNPTTTENKRVRGRFHSDDVSRFAITIGKPQSEVWAFFRDFTNFPLFMKDVKSVEVQSTKKSHWTIQLKNGLKAEWDAEITLERPEEMLAWKSVKGSEVETSGSVWFSPAGGGRGTVVSLVLDYKIPGGKLAEFLTQFTGENPDMLASTNLRRLKALLETGDVPTTEGQPSGREATSEEVLTH